MADCGSVTESKPPAKKKYKRNYSEAEIQSRRDRARRQIAEGTFGGGSRGQGRKPKTMRAGGFVSDKAAEEQTKARIWRALSANLADDRPAAVRMKAALAILDVERQEASLTLKEEVAYDQMTQGDLIKGIVGVLGKALKSGNLPPELGALFSQASQTAEADYVEGHLIDETEEEPEQPVEDVA